MEVPAISLIALFLAEILILFLLSRFLISALGRFLHRLTGSRNMTVNILAIIFLPGTILHELAHLLVAGMMFVPVGRIEVLPQIDGDEVRLGSAEIAQTDILRRTIIGLAPIFVGLLVIISLLWIFGSRLGEESFLWQTALVLYIIFQVSNSMFSSKKDMEGVLLFLIGVMLTFAVIIFAIYSFGFLPAILEQIGKNLAGLESFFGRVNLFLMVPLGLDLVFFGLAKVLKLKAG